MSHVLILGGHGKVALLLEPLLAAAGHQVTAIIRNPDQFDEVARTGATPLVFDVEHASVDELASAMAGLDAVVWSAGAGGGAAERTYAVDRDAAMRSMDAALQARVQRYVMVSYSGARADHGVPPQNSFFAYAESKAAADEYLRSTSLDWTVLGPSGLTLDAGTGAIEVTTDSKTVPRADVAAVILACLGEPATIGRTIPFNAGSVPIAEALSSLG